MNRLRVKNILIEVETLEDLESSTIREMTYDPEFYILLIQFRSGEIYRYNLVPKSVWEGFKKTNSYGQFFSQYIKNNYPFVKLS
jgi:hypothetical protein